MEVLPDDIVYGPTKMKKKKKKKKTPDASDTSLEKLNGKTENLAISDGEGSSFKGKPALTGSFNYDNAYPRGDSDVDKEGEEVIAPLEHGWEGTDRDYEYKELLNRIFNTLHEENPELAGDRRRTVMRPPQVLLEGTKKTVLVNFMDTCKIMHREPKHVMTFFREEMQTSASIDIQKRLVMKGRFAPKDLEVILWRYINEYVICTCCKGPDTSLVEENNSFFLRCELCGSQQSVAPIRTGFARVGNGKNET